MNDETNTQQGAGAAAPAEQQGNAQQAANTAPAPRNDAEAQQQEAAAKAKQEAANQEQEQAKKPNRTREYIDKINRDNAEMRRRLAQLEAGQQPSQQQPNNSGAGAARTAHQGDAEPTLEDHDFDVEAYTRAHSAWAVRHELQKQQTQQTAAAAAAQREERWTTYTTRATEFADANPDFFEVVGLIAHPLSNEVQDAIAAHAKGPEIAYHLGNNDDDAFELASIQPHLAAAAVERLAKRLSAAPAKPEANQSPQQNNLAAASALAASQTKPISQAPPPAPTVGGRSPADVPQEKLTDDDWYKRDVERRRKR